MRNIVPVFILFYIGMFSVGTGYAQRALTPEELSEWRRITGQSLSNDGNWAAAKIAPWEGDATVCLYDRAGAEKGVYTPAGDFGFSASSGYLLLSLTSEKSLTDSLKLAKTKREKMPMNKLLIRRLPEGEELLDSIRAYRLAEEADWLAYQRARKDSTLFVRSLDGGKRFSFPSVSEFRFARKSSRIWFVTGGDTLGTAAGLYVFDPEKGTPELVKPGKDYYKNITWDENGDRLAFLHCEKKDSAYKALTLWLYDFDREAVSVARRGDPAFPADWVVSEHGSLMFSEDGTRLFFGTSPEPRQPDETRLAEDWPGVQVWSWDEPVQYTVQNHNKESSLKRNYRAVYDISNRRLIQLADSDLPDFQQPGRGKGEYALLSTTRPYSVSSMWEGRTRRDMWSVSFVDGSRTLLKEAFHGNPRLSPAGKYAYWYAPADSAWCTIELATGKEYRLTTPQSFPAWDEENDTPDHPGAHGVGGWSPDDRYLLIYDRYDIWRFDPTGAADPVNLTGNGRNEKIRYRLLQLDPEERTVDLSKPQYLTGFNETTKGNGYYQADLSKTSAPKTLLSGNYMLSVPLKAKHSDAVLYTWQTYEDYPELQFSDLTFKRPVRLTNEGRQQEGIKWGTAELVSWTSLDGKKLEGMVFKPADFDPNKKYPLLVNFYERYSETLYNYHMPNPHRSTIDYHLYNSNDYIIFNPDVVYDDGYPGESCFNCVMPGISMLIGQGFIDEESIGAQGHSWGAYQVAYLATRTDLFAAIESGAPVVNMFSAYGGIRWGTGLARSFQYEHTQSRIGGTPWSHFREFVENSPLFAMDKVTTPILIMHNDNDGHVPWYQGIEYFVALKRLQKPAWLLNYTGEVHWPGKMPNRVDFQKRMFQFFNHYLKREPMPKWMSEGVPAVDQDFELGYELTEE